VRVVCAQPVVRRNEDKSASRSRFIMRPEWVETAGKKSVAQRLGPLTFL